MQLMYILVYIGTGWHSLYILVPMWMHFDVIMIKHFGISNYTETIRISWTILGEDKTDTHWPSFFTLCLLLNSYGFLEEKKRKKRKRKDSRPRVLRTTNLIDKVHIHRTEILLHIFCAIWFSLHPWTKLFVREVIFNSSFIASE
jgi:hypothetical protein